jgi:hypothetical protein
MQYTPPSPPPAGARRGRGTAGKIGVKLTRKRIEKGSNSRSLNNKKRIRDCPVIMWKIYKREHKKWTILRFCRKKETLWIRSRPRISTNKFAKIPLKLT